MKHGILFSSLLLCLIVIVGGVFVLIMQRKEEQQEIAKEAFVASPAGVNNELFEAKLQTEQIDSLAAIPRPPKQVSIPKPQPTPVVLTPSQTPPPLPPSPIPVPEPSPTQVSTPLPAGRFAPIPAPQPSPQAQPEAPKIKININTAGYEELQQITGIGPIIAQRVIDYRNTNGQFQRIEDLKNVSGIGDVTFEKMRNEITVGNVAVNPPPPPTSAPPPETKTLEKININIASYEELQEITGVGEVIAQRIIDYREQNGPFQKIEDIKSVKGVGDATFEKMKDEITI
ncbi:MAG: helix-hairpin-helix domain-containing protein [Patescibacteria group bacterium]